MSFLTKLRDLIAKEADAEAPPAKLADPAELEKLVAKSHLLRGIKPFIREGCALPNDVTEAELQHWKEQNAVAPRDPAVPLRDPATIRVDGAEPLTRTIERIPIPPEIWPMLATRTCDPVLSGGETVDHDGEFKEKLVALNMETAIEVDHTAGAATAAAE